jgi:hypothetical protein
MKLSTLYENTTSDQMAGGYRVAKNLGRKVYKAMQGKVANDKKNARSPKSLYSIMGYGSKLNTFPVVQNYKTGMVDHRKSKFMGRFAPGAPQITGA